MFLYGRFVAGTLYDKTEQRLKERSATRQQASLDLEAYKKIWPKFLI